MTTENLEEMKVAHFPQLADIYLSILEGQNAIAARPMARAPENTRYFHRILPHSGGAIFEN
jgi:hypothetical protein